MTNYKKLRKKINSCVCTATFAMKWTTISINRQTYMPLLSLTSAFIVQLVVIKCDNPVLCVCVFLLRYFFSRIRCTHLCINSRKGHGLEHYWNPPHVLCPFSSNTTVILHLLKKHLTALKHTHVVMIKSSACNTVVCIKLI